MICLVNASFFHADILICSPTQKIVKCSFDSWEDALKLMTGRVGSIDTLADLIISVAQSIATEYAHKQ